jgi:hypothetical protein
MTGVARHRQDSSWLFITKCDYKQYGIHCVVEGSNLPDCYHSAMHIGNFNTTSSFEQNQCKKAKYSKKATKIKEVKKSKTER